MNIDCTHTLPPRQRVCRPTSPGAHARILLSQFKKPFGNRNSAVWSGFPSKDVLCCVITNVLPMLCFSQLRMTCQRFLLLVAVVAASIQGAWALWMGQGTRLADVGPVWASSVLKWVRAWENLRVLDLYTQPKDWNANFCCTWIQCRIKGL